MTTRRPLAESIAQLRAVLLEWRRDPAWHAHEDPVASLWLRRAERRP
jgi:hypothetical protein